MKNLNIITLIAIVVLALSSCAEDCDHAQNQCDLCPTGFTKNIVNDNCEKITTVPSIFNGPFQNIVKADTNVAYTFGANFYNVPSTATLPIHSTATGLVDDVAVPITTLGTATGNFWSERLNITGVWSPGVGVNQWIGFSQCIEVAVDTKVCIGIAADNQCRFYINTTTTAIVAMNVTHAYNYNYWHVFEYNLLAGTNIIMMSGLDAVAPAAFGAEIYRADLATVQAWTSVTELEDALIFSTKDQSKFQTGLVSGYSCPSGFVVDFCGDTTAVCTSIEREPYLPCQNIVIP